MPAHALRRAALAALLALMAPAGCGACGEEQPSPAPSAAAPAPADADPAPAAVGPDREARGAPPRGVVTPEEERPLRPEVAAAKAQVLADPIDPAALDAAKAALTSAIAAAPADADALYWRGRAAARGGDWAAALPDFEAARAKDPAFVGAQRWSAAALVSARRCDAAIPLLDALISAAVDDANSWYNRGACRFQQEQLPQALADIEKACALDHALACEMTDRVRRRLEATEAGGVPRHGATVPFTAPDGTPARPGGGLSPARAAKAGGLGKGAKLGKAGKGAKLGKAGKGAKLGKAKMKAGKAKAKAKAQQASAEE